MTATGDTDIRRWVWVMLPWVVALLVVLAFALLPSADCTGGPTPDRSAFVVVALIALAIPVGAAVVRIVQLTLGPMRPPPEQWPLLGLCGGLSIYSALAYGVGSDFHLAGTAGALFVGGIVLALGVYFVMSALVVQRGADAIGVLVPISLLFIAGLLVAPLMEIGYVLPEGGFC